MDNDAPTIAHNAEALLTDKQLAERLGIHPFTPANWRARREGPPFIRLGRLVRYSPAAVEEWLRSRTQAPAANVA